MRGRFAPSPTGSLHLGNLRTALLAWLFARSQSSGFVLRFEDLDALSVRAPFYDEHRRDLEALGIDWDDELRQSEHLDRYRAVIADLVDRDLVYPCYCSRREIREAAAAPHGDLPDGAYPGTCRRLSQAERRRLEREGRRPALRLRTDGQEYTIHDRRAGDVTLRLDDHVLARRDGTPAYNLVVVVDDDHQQIEEVVRGDDLLSSTPRQAHLAELLGIQPPAYAHVPLVLGPTGHRLAKRDGSVTLTDRVELGETPDEVRSWLACSVGLLEPGEAATAAELIERFEPDGLPDGPWQLTPVELHAGEAPPADES